jgi:gliding motility-associated-like protein
MLWGQESSSAVRLGDGGMVTNSIIYQNSGYKSVSAQHSTIFSALDSMASGVGNVHLTSSPFANQFRIHLNSPAHNTGLADVLRDHDTLDLDNNARLNCERVDMGAFEVQLEQTVITREPLDVRTIFSATPTYTLTVEATGENLRYQWQYENEDLEGATLPEYTLSGEWQDTGVYRVIVFSDCCNDTSVSVRVMYDDAWVDYGGFCPGEESWARVQTSGGSYTFLWDDGSTGSEVRGLAAGEHWVEIFDPFRYYATRFFLPEGYTPVSEDVFIVTQPDNENCDNGAIELAMGFVTHIDHLMLYTFNWTVDGDFLSEDPVLRNLPSGNTYQLEITKVSTGCTDTFDFALTCGHEFNAATTFISPNGDGLNDYLDIKNIERYPTNKVTIINLYGEEIFSTENYDNNKVVWQGQNRSGKLVPDGVYNYIVDVNGQRVMAGWLVMKIAE